MMNDGNHPLFLLEKLFGENSDAIIKNFHKLQKDLTQTCLSVRNYNSLNMRTGKCCDSNKRAVTGTGRVSRICINDGRFDGKSYFGGNKRR